jgi:hypothetical protein
MPTPLNFYKKNPYNSTGALKVDAIFATDNSSKLITFQGWLADGAVVNSLNEALIANKIGVVDTEGLNINLCNRFAYTIMSNSKYVNKSELIVVKFEGYINPLLSTISEGSAISFINNTITYGELTGNRPGYGYKIQGITKNLEIDISSMIYSAVTSKVTVTTDQAHGLITGDNIIITGVVPSTYNSTSTSGNIVITKLTDTTFEYTSAINPGAYISSGKVLKLGQTLILSEAIRGRATVLSGAATGATSLTLSTPIQGQIIPGQLVTGTNISPGTTVVSYSVITNILNLSSATTGNIAIGATLNFEIDSTNSSPSIPLGSFVTGVASTNAFSAVNAGKTTSFQRSQTPFNYYVPGDSRLKYFWSSYTTPVYGTNFDGWAQNFLTGTGGSNGDKGDFRFTNGVSGTQVQMLYGNTLATATEDTFNNIDKVLNIERADNGDDYTPRLKSALLYISASNEQGSSGSRTDTSRGSETPGVTLKKTINTLRNNSGYWVGVSGGDLSEVSAQRPDGNRIEPFKKDNFDANVFRITPNATATSTFTGGVTTITVSGVSGTIVIGQTVSGNGIYPGSTVTNVVGNSVTLSNAVTSNQTNVSLKFVDSPEYRRLRADPRGFTPSVGTAKTVKFGVPIAPEFCTLYPSSGPGPGIDGDGMYNIGLNYNHNFTYETPTPTTPITLNGAINSSVTQLTVNDATALRLNIFIKIDNEYLAITDIVGNLITVQRARLTSTAASHSNGASVSIVPYCSIRIRDCFFDDLNGIYRAFVTDTDLTNSKSFWITYKGSSVFPTTFTQPYAFGLYGFVVNLTMLFSVPNTFYRRSTFNFLYPPGAGSNYVPTVSGSIGDQKSVLATVKVSETNGFLEKGTSTLRGKISLYTVPGTGFYTGITSGTYYSYYKDIIFQSTIVSSPVIGASSTLTKVYDAGLSKVFKGDVLETYLIFDQVKSELTSYLDEKTGTLETGVNTTSTTLTVNVTSGPFSSGYYGKIAIPGTSTFEIIKITAVSTVGSVATLTVDRAQLGSTAQSWGSGVLVHQYATLTLNNISQINAPATATSTFAASTNTLNLTNVSGTISIGQLVSGTGIPANTTVINYAGNVLTISNGTTSAQTSASLSFSSVISKNNVIRGKNIKGGSIVIDYTGNVVTVSDAFYGDPTPNVGDFIYFGVVNLTKKLDLLVNKRNNFKDISGVVSFPGYGYKVGNALTSSPILNPFLNVASAFWTFDSSISATGLQISGTSASTPFTIVYSGKTGDSSGDGVNATFNVTRNVNQSYTVELASPGSGYVLGETITILGTDLGGATPDNDLVITVGSLNELSKVTMQTTEPHGFVPPAGRTTCRLLIKNVSPVNYNGRYEATILDEFTFSYLLPDDPGTYQSGGIVKNISIDIINDVFSFITNKLFLNITETTDLEYPYIRYFQRATVVSKLVTVTTDEVHNLNSTTATATFALGESTLTLTNPITTGGGTFKVGQAVSGTGLGENTTIKAINGNIITLSRPTAAAGTAIAISIGDRVNVGGVINSTRVSWNEFNARVTVLDTTRFTYTITASGNEGTYTSGGYITDPRILPFGGVYTKNFDRMILINISDQVVGGEINPKTGLPSDNIIQPRKSRDFLVRNLNFRSRSNDNDIVQSGEKNDYVLTTTSQLAVASIEATPIVNAIWQDGRILATTPSDIPISNITNTGTTITVTTSVAHPYLIGNNVVIAGSSVEDFNGEFTVLTVPTATTFTCQCILTPSTSQSFAAPTATWANASTTITVSSNNGISLDQYVIATGIPYQTKVTNINGNTITISKSTTAAQATAATVRFSSLTTGAKHHLYAGNRIDVNGFAVTDYESSSEEDTVQEVVDDYNFYYGDIQLSDGSFFGKERLTQPTPVTSTPPTRIGSFNKSLAVFPEGVGEITVVSDARSIPALDASADHYVVAYNVGSGQTQYTTFSISLTRGGVSEVYERAISNIQYTQSVNKATVFTSGAHSLVTGDIITISGVSPSFYNGDYRVTKISSDSFSYSPPQVKTTAILPNIEGSTLYNQTGTTFTGTYTQTGNIITVTTSGANGFVVGQTVYVDFTGAPTDGYYTVLTKPTTTSFTIYRSTSATIASTSITGTRSAYYLPASSTQSTVNASVANTALTLSISGTTSIGSTVLTVASSTNVTLGQLVVDALARDGSTTTVATATATSFTQGSATFSVTGITGTILAGQYVRVLVGSGQGNLLFPANTTVTSFTSTGTGTGTVVVSNPASLSAASTSVSFRTNRIPANTRVISKTATSVTLNNAIVTAALTGSVELQSSIKDSYSLVMSSVTDLHLGQLISTDTNQFSSLAIIEDINTTTNTIGLSAPMISTVVQGTYTKSGTTATVTTPTAHGLLPGDKIFVSFGGPNATSGNTNIGGIGYAVVLSGGLTSTQFTYTDGVNNTFTPTPAPYIYYQKIPSRITAASNIQEAKSLKVASVTGVVVGYSASGTSVPSSTTVVSVDSTNNRVYLSQRLVGTFTQPTAISTFSSGATTITLSGITGTITSGQTISGSGISAGTTVTAFNTSTSVVTLSTATISNQTNAGLTFDDTIIFGTGAYNNNGLIRSVNTPVVNNRLVRRGLYSNGAINVIPDKLGWDHVNCAKDTRGAIFFQLGFSKIMSGTAGSTTLTISAAAPYNETTIPGGILPGYFVYGEGIQGETRITAVTNNTIIIDKPLLADVNNINVGISRKDSVSIFPKYTVEFGRVLGKTFAEWLFKIA